MLADSELPSSRTHQKLLSVPLSRLTITKHYLPEAQHAPTMLLSLLPPLLALVSLANAETKQFKTPDGISYTYDHVPAQNSQPTVLFVHGFPSGRQDWHHQIDNLTAEGYGIIAPDCLGYGDTDAPLDLESYNLRTIAGHFKALLDHEGVEQVVGVAHDWGVIILSHAAVWYPGSFDKLAFLSVGYNPPGRLDIDAANAQSLGQLGYTQLGYWYFFNTYDAEDVLFEHVRTLEHPHAAAESLLTPSSFVARLVLLPCLSN